MGLLRLQVSAVGGFGAAVSGVGAAVSAARAAVSPDRAAVWRGLQCSQGFSAARARLCSVVHSAGQSLQRSDQQMSHRVVAEEVINTRATGEG